MEMDEDRAIAFRRYYQDSLTGAGGYIVEMYMDLKPNWGFIKDFG